MLTRIVKVQAMHRMCCFPKVICFEFKTHILVQKQNIVIVKLERMLGECQLKATLLLVFARMRGFIGLGITPTSTKVHKTHLLVQKQNIVKLERMLSECQLKVKLLLVLATTRGFHRIGDNTQKHNGSQECGDWILVEFVTNYK